MRKIAVVAHSRKNFGGGLRELREVLAREGVTDPLWYEVTRSREAPECARHAAAQGIDVVFLWGGDGMVQRCIDAVAGTDAVVAILPAGAANLLAMNLEIPDDLTGAVRVGLRGDRRLMDTGSVNGEHFTVMAGAGFDARMIEDARRDAKRRPGRVAHLYAALRNLGVRRVKVLVEVDGRRFFEGRASCVLTGNVGKILGGVEAFPEAQPDDGLLELGVITAKNLLQWARTFALLALGRAGASPFVEVTRGERIRIWSDQKLPYELDGGARPPVRELRIRARPGSIKICVPAKVVPVSPKGPPDPRDRSRNLGWHLTEARTRSFG